MIQPPTTRRLIVLGSTGSIGVNTLRVVEHLNALAGRDDGSPRFEVVGLAAGRNADVLIEQARRFNVKTVALCDGDRRDDLCRALPNATCFAGDDAALRLVESIDGATDLVAAIVGSAGLPATLLAIEKGMRIGLANKETLVAAGPLVTPLVRRHGAVLLPIDSEHSAIFQCVGKGQGLRAKGQGTRQPSDAQSLGPRSSALGPSDPLDPFPSTLSPCRIKRIILTASGGPFRTTPLHEMQNATVEQALKHPTWNMGPKITIDSATMMNKALEIIEAHWLFDMPADRIDVIIHPQSVAHSFVEFEDNSVLAQLGPPDMKTPIQYALTWPDRPPGCSEKMDWSKLSTLVFEQPDHEKFGALRLAYDVIAAGGTAGAIFNAANEEAVAAFLERRIRFGRITELVADALASLEIRPADSLETIYAADREARTFVKQRVVATAGT